MERSNATLQCGIFLFAAEYKQMSIVHAEEVKIIPGTIRSERRTKDDQRRSLAPKCSHDAPTQTTKVRIAAKAPAKSTLVVLVASSVTNSINYEYCYYY